jgi:chaperonin GroES
MEAFAAAEGDVSDLIDQSELSAIASRAVEEAAYDREARSAWQQTINRALKAAIQDAEPKTTPWPNAANVKHPLLTEALVQFGSRAYGALLRDDQVVKPKVFGADPQGLKRARGERLAEFTNYQLLYLCDEWDPGTDQLVHMLPLHGKAYRKIFWNVARNRPVLDTVSAENVLVPNDAISLDQAPRVTQTCSYFPFEVRQKIALGVWANHEISTTGDSQKPIPYLEQYRYDDLDRDGLPEPYVATIHCDTHTVVRLEPAFDPSKLRITESGAGDALVRDLPWVDYDFLPNPQGGFHSIGFAHLLEPLQGTINSLINQILDAGTRANMGGGFISAGLKLRAGTVRVQPGDYWPINAAGDVRAAIHELRFNGPSPVLFSALEFLLGAAQRVIGSAEVLSGDVPAGQRLAEGTVLALIEQGMQVHSALYKRLYRSERRALRRLFGLNRDFLSAEAYERVLDVPGADPRQDFDMAGVDVMPVSDPSSVTDTQRLTRANFLASRVAAAPGLYNAMEVERRVLEAARIPNVEAVLQVGPNSQMMLAQEQAVAQIGKLKAETNAAEARAAQAYQQAQGEALERGVRTGELAGVVGGAPGRALPGGAAANGAAGQGDLGAGELG